MERSVRHTVYFQCPWSLHPGQYDLDKAWRTFMDRKEQDGWRMVKIERQWQTPEPVVSQNGDLVREFNLEVLLARPARKQVIDMPDHLVPELLKQGKGRITLAS